MIIAILAILYLITSIGIVWHYHYCMGQLVRCEIWENKKSTCSQCGMPLKSQSGDNDCCKDEYKYVKDDNDQQFSNTFTLTKTKLLFTPIYDQQVSISLSTTFSSVALLPIKVVKRSYYCTLNLINCNFRI